MTDGLYALFITNRTTSIEEYYFSSECIQILVAQIEKYWISIQEHNFIISILHHDTKLKYLRRAEDLINLTNEIRYHLSHPGELTNISNSMDHVDRIDHISSNGHKEKGSNSHGLFEYELLFNDLTNTVSDISANTNNDSVQSNQISKFDEGDNESNSKLNIKSDYILSKINLDGYQILSDAFLNDDKNIFECAKCRRLYTKRKYCIRDKCNKRSIIAEMIQ